MMLRQTRSRTRAAAECKTPSDEISLPSHNMSLDESKVDSEEEAKKRIKFFDSNYDDSSDEDEINDKVNHYDIEKNWQRIFNRSYRPDNKDFINNDELLSFVAHAAGIKLFYSSQVNTKYYPLKHLVLSEKKPEENAISQLQLLVQTALIDSLHKSFNSLEIFLKSTEQKEISLTEYSTKKEIFLTEYQNEIKDMLSSHLGSFVKWIKLIKFTDHTTRPDGIDAFEKKSIDLLKKVFEKHYSFTKSFQDRDKIKQELLHLAKEKINFISKELFFQNLENVPGKEKALESLKQFETPYQGLLQLIKSILLKSPARGYVQNMLNKELDSSAKQSTLLRTYINDLILIKNSKGVLTEKEMNVLTDYLSVNEESVYEELFHNFVYFQKINLENAVNSLRRPTLGECYRFNSNNPYNFHANLRLANRSQTRQINNLQSALFRSDRSARFWHLSDFSSDVPSVFEAQEILKTSFGRRDMILHLGNYASVYEEIKHIKEYFSSLGECVNDKKIAQWIRDIFKGNPPAFHIPESDEIEILHKLQAITYLLLGCEATRNPSMHVINQMLLDLIITNDEWSFEEALTGEKNGKIVSEKLAKRMPMAPEGAVAVARHLMSDYRNFMPCSYSYRGSVDRENNKFNKQDLIKYEARIIRDWVMLTNTDKVKLPKNQATSWLLNYIENHFENWLGSPDAKLAVTKLIK